MADEPSEAVSDPSPAIDSEKAKRKSVIVWQCLNPECTNNNKRILRWVILKTEMATGFMFFMQDCQQLCAVILRHG